MAGVEKLVTHERKFGREMWGLLCLELWFRAFIDGDAIPPLPKKEARPETLVASASASKGPSQSGERA